MSRPNDAPVNGTSDPKVDTSEFWQPLGHRDAAKAGEFCGRTGYWSGAGAIVRRAESSDVFLLVSGPEVGLSFCTIRRKCWSYGELPATRMWGGVCRSVDHGRRS